MYSTLITKIQTTLESVSEVAKVYPYPIGEAKLTEYPSAIFYPVSIDNEFNTDQDNFKQYNFKLYLVTGTKGISKETLFTSTLPNLLDAVLEQFDQDWSINGSSRIWQRINFGTWGMTEDGNEAIIELNIIIKALTTI